MSGFSGFGRFANGITDAFGFALAIVPLTVVAAVMLLVWCLI